MKKLKQREVKKLAAASTSRSLDVHSQESKAMLLPTTL